MQLRAHLGNCLKHLAFVRSTIGSIGLHSEVPALGSLCNAKAEWSSYRVGHGTPPKAKEFRCLDVQRPPDMSCLFVSTSSLRTSLITSREMLDASPRAPHPRMRHSSPKKHRCGEKQFLGAAGFQWKSFAGAPTYLLKPLRRRKGNPRFFDYFGLFFGFFLALGTEITCRSNVVIAGLTLPTATKFGPPQSW
jgi:hypothetical protein